MKTKDNIKINYYKTNKDNDKQSIKNIKKSTITNTLNYSSHFTSSNLNIIKDIIEKTKLKDKNKIQNRSTENSFIKKEVNNIIVDNKYLLKSGIKEKKKRLGEDAALYQSFLLEEYKNPIINTKKNLIERLGESIEKKYKKIELFKNKRYENIHHNCGKTKITGNSDNQTETKSNSINEKRTFVGLDKKIKNSFSSSHILDKKKAGDFPLLLSVPSSYLKKFSSCSEKMRNEKNILTLFKLKHFLNLYWPQKREIIKEFFIKMNINEPEFYKGNNLDNFAHYINDNINNDGNLNDYNCDIETRISMHDIISKGIKYRPNGNLENNSYNNYKNGSNKLSKKLKLKVKRNISEDLLSEEKEFIDAIIARAKITKYRNFLDRNYKMSVTNALLKGLTKEEKLKYFSKKKYGQVEILDKNNLANNLHKQALYIKRFNPQQRKYYNKSSIKYYNNDDLKMLHDELNDASYSIIKKFENQKMKKTQEKILGKKYKGLNEKIIDKLNHRLYYTIKEKYHLNQPEVIPTQKKKLLEYIIAQKLEERNDFEQKIINSMK
jgi:hypothetical protein